MDNATCFRVGDWVVRAVTWGGPLGAMRVRRVSRAPYEMARLHVGYDVGSRSGWMSLGFRHATPEETAAVPIEEGDWASTVMAANCDHPAIRIKAHSLMPCNIQSWRHATPEEYRAATSAAPDAEAVPDPATDTALEDSRDELIPPTEQEVELAERIVELERRIHGALARTAEEEERAGRLRGDLDQALLERDVSQQFLGGARERIAKLEAGPELPPMLWDRITGEGPFIEVPHKFEAGTKAREPYDAYLGADHTYYYRGDGQANVMGRPATCGVFRWPATLTPVEPPRAEVRLDPVPAADTGPSRARAVALFGLLAALYVALCATMNAVVNALL